MNDDKTVQIRIEKHLWRDEKEIMRKQRSAKILMFFLLIFMFVFGWVSHGFLKPNIGADTEGLQRLQQMIKIMSNNWYYSSESTDIYNDLINRAMKGMATVDKDPYTEYLSVQELLNFEQGINQTYTGIGVEMSMATDYPLVIRVFYDSPAEKGEIQIGDFITNVDDVDIKGMKYEDVRPLVMGEVGTEVKITIERDGKKIDKHLKRAYISNTVYVDIINDEIGYVQISTFGSGTAKEFTHALDELKNKNIDKLIIDLRDNGGGYLNIVNEMADCFLQKNEIIFKQVYVNNEEMPYKATSNIIYKFDKMVILINANTASASEVFASCMQDHGIATIVGEKSYGKGTSQMIYTFADGSALKYTQTHWYSAKGNQINTIGITPDYLVSLPQVLELAIPETDDTLLIKYDQVDSVVAYIQAGLGMMGYEVDRQDGYFSKATLAAVNRFQADHGLAKNTYIDNEFFRRFVAEARKYYAANKAKLDSQYAKAIELMS